MSDLPARPITVLVAGDDDRDDTKQLLRELSAAGYELRWVGSAEEAADAPYAIVSTRALTDLAELHHDTLHDALTGLPNRVLFLDRLELSVAPRAPREDEFCCAVLFLDLDRFKLVNDSLGHLVGDRLLMAVASAWRRALRPGDTVARLGGDEFTVLLDDIGDVRRRVGRGRARCMTRCRRRSWSRAASSTCRPASASRSSPRTAARGRCARRRRRDVPREGPGRRPPRRLRPGHARARAGRGSSSRPACGRRSRPASAVLYQPVVGRRRARSPASRRCAAGRTAPATRSRRASSSRSPTRPG